MKLVPGLYEAVVTKALAEQRDAQSDFQALTSEAAPHVLARHLHDLLLKAFRSLPEADRGAKQVELTNQIIALIEREAKEGGVNVTDSVAEPAELLMAVREALEARLVAPTPLRPLLSLRQSDLLVNGPRDLSVGHLIRAELASADRVDVLMSFVKFNGVRMLLQALTSFARRRPGALRVLTTTYMGATEVEALEVLQQLGAEIRVSYDH